MAPRQGGGGGERKEGGAWVKKTGTATATEGAEDESEKPKRNEKGRGRQSGKGARREPRDNTAEEGATEGRSRGRGKGGRNSARRGQAQEQTATADNHDDDEDEDRETMGNALMTLLKANPPKVAKYSKGELLSIARLPASNIKPPNLCPLIDSDNKDSQLLIRVPGRQGGGEEDGADQAARKDRREKRANPKAERGSDEAEAPEKAKQTTTAVPPVSASSPSTPNRGTARAAEAPQGKAAAVTKPAPVEEDANQASRGLEKWFPGKTLEKGSTGTTPPVTPASGSVGAPNASVTSATGTGSSTAPAPGSVGTSPAGSQGFPAASLLQQQAAQSQAAHNAHVQALATQAYIQNAAIQMAAQSRGQWPWGGYNPYAAGGFPPYGNPYGGYPSGMDYTGRQAGAFGGLGSAAEAKLFASAAAQMGAYGGLGGTNTAATRKASMPKSQAAPSSTGSAPRPKKAAAPDPASLEAPLKSSLAPVEPLPKDTVGEAKGDEEDEAGCSQS